MSQHQIEFPSLTPQPQEMERHSKANWRHDACLRLLQLIEEKKSVIEGKIFNAEVTAKMRRDAWDNITLSLNASFPDTFRTKCDVEKKWWALKAQGREELCAYRKAFTGTGGGPPPEPLSEIAMAVETIFGRQNEAISGIDDAQESSLELLSTEDESMSTTMYLTYEDGATMLTPASSSLAPQATSSNSTQPPLTSAYIQLMRTQSTQPPMPSTSGQAPTSSTSTSTQPPTPSTSTSTQPPTLSPSTSTHPLTPSASTQPLTLAASSEPPTLSSSTQPLSPSASAQPPTLLRSTSGSLFPLPESIFQAKKQKAELELLEAKNAAAEAQRAASLAMQAAAEAQRKAYELKIQYRQLLLSQSKSSK